MGDDIVQLAGDASPFAARRVLEHGARDDLPRGRVRQGLAARPLRHAGQGSRRRQRREQHGEHPRLAARGAGQREHQERRGEHHGQELRAAAAEPIPGDQLRSQARDGQKVEQRE